MRRKVTTVKSLLALLLLSTSLFSLADSASSTYESVRALDRSGQALQLKHAQAAADQQGRLILAFSLHNNNESSAVYILSPSTDDMSSSHKQRHYQRCLPSTCSRTLLSQRITNDNDDSTFAICTGVQADARWLIRQLQSYAKVVQLRYGIHPLSVATATSALVRTLFWGYEDDDNDKHPAWQSSIQDVWKGQKRWGRPVGVRTLVIAPRDDVASGKYSLQIVEPSGVITHCPRFACMGRQSELIRAKLEQLLLERDDKAELGGENDVQDAVQQALLATMVSPPEKLHVEVISAGGVERKTWSLKV